MSEAGLGLLFLADHHQQILTLNPEGRVSFQTNLSFTIQQPGRSVFRQSHASIRLTERFFKYKSTRRIGLMSFCVWKSFLHTLIPIMLFPIPVGRSFISPVCGNHTSFPLQGSLGCCWSPGQSIVLMKNAFKDRLTISSCLLESDFGAIVGSRMISSHTHTHTHHSRFPTAHC